MAEWDLIQDRVISGKGVLQIPSDGALKVRAYTLCIDVIRDPSNKYLSLDWNPPRSRYANIVYLRKGYALQTSTVEYPKQMYDGIHDISGQVLEAVKCSYKGTLESIYNLALAIAGTPGGIGLTPTTIDNLIADYASLRLTWDEIRIKCYADTALQVRLYRLGYDGCGDDSIDEKPAPETDAPIPKVPVGTPVPNSDPYDEDNSDDGNSIPYPGDAPLPPEPCVTVIRGAGLNANTCDPLGNSGDYIYNGYAELRPVNVPPNNCAGLRLFLDGVDLGDGQTYHPSAIVLSRTGDCVPPQEV